MLAYYENLELSSACEAVLEIETASKDIVNVLEAMRIVAIAISPITPSLALRIYTQLGYSEDQFNAVTWTDTRWGGLKQGHIMAQPKPVFARIELETKLNEDTSETKRAVSQEKEGHKAEKVVEA